MLIEKKYLASLLFIAVVSAAVASGPVLAHDAASPPPMGDSERRISFPDTADHRTLAADLHTHSVFSDGHVWPRTRVEEALRDGLAALAITEHLEWQPHRDDIPHDDRNRAYEIAAQAAKPHDLIVIAGAEVTREMPAGHINAIFIADANALYAEPGDGTATLDADAYYDSTGEWPAGNALAAANEQNAFVFWNHPDWTAQAPDGIARPTEFHLDAIENNALHGIEIANGQGYSEEAFALALEHDLALIGVSDIHDLIDWDYEPHNGGHRPVTLVLATERSADGIRDALFARRTVVWYKNMLFGRPAHLVPLLDTSIVASDAAYIGETTTISLTLTNTSDARFILDNRSDYTFLNSADLVEVPPHDAVELIVKPRALLETLALEFEVLNALVAPGQPATITLRMPVAGLPQQPGE